jgi:pimeloyl-ACP methyl ester carboxylesterase
MPTAPVPPTIPGVRRSRVQVRGVDFHVTEAGPVDGTPVVCLHGWPEHHYEYRDLLAKPPAGLRIIAPDLPGYGWSGPPPHAWYKEEIAADVIALLEAMGIERCVLVGHDWGGFIGHLMVLRDPQRFSSYLALNISHPWVTPKMLLPHLWRFLLYQPAVAAFGVPLQERTNMVVLAIRSSMVDRQAVTREQLTWYGERFRDPVCARAGRDTYRTFWLRELPKKGMKKETRRSTVPTLCVFGVEDSAVHYSLAAAESARADEYRLELVPSCGHFIVDERPELIRERVISLASQF